MRNNTTVYSFYLNGENYMFSHLCQFVLEAMMNYHTRVRIFKYYNNNSRLTSIIHNGRIISRNDSDFACFSH